MSKIREAFTRQQEDRLYPEPWPDKQLGVSLADSGRAPTGSAIAPVPPSSGTTPSDPSRAILIRLGRICPYCGKTPNLVDSARVYGGRSYGMIWLCAPCNAYVGVHRGTTTPKGRLADSELRKWKMQAHAKFDPIWKQGHLSRGEAYQWLATRMNMTVDECHIGMFDVKQCEEACLTLEEWEGVTTTL